MITSGETTVYNPVVHFDVVVHYDVLPVASDRVQVFLYDNNFHYIGGHEFSGVSFQKAPDYWVSLFYGRLLSGLSRGDDSWTVPSGSPTFAPWRENGEPAETARTSGQSEKGGHEA